MTLEEGKKKVYELLDEYSSGGEITVDEDIELKMADFFDIAQKELANLVPIVRLYVPEESGEITMPDDFLRLKTVWRNGKPWRGGTWKAGKLYASGNIEIEYLASPATVDADTEDSYEFEIDDNAAQAMPFYVAAQQLLVDLVMDYAAPLGIWERRKQELAARCDGTQQGVRQTLYR